MTSRQKDSIERVKNYLRIDNQEDDEFLKELIDISDAYICSMVGDKWKSDTSLIKLGDILQLKLILDLYENRGNDITTKTIKTKRDIVVDSILDKLANYEGGE